MSPNSTFSPQSQHPSLATVTPVLLAASTFPLFFARNRVICDAITVLPLSQEAGHLMSGLMQCARDGDLASVQQLLQWLLSSGGASIAERANAGMGALLWAAWKGYLALVQWLLSSGGASITERDQYGQSALLYAHMEATSSLCSGSCQLVGPPSPSAMTIASLLSCGQPPVDMPLVHNGCLRKEERASMRQTQQVRRCGICSSSKTPTRTHWRHC
jgi:hypothetical protein